MNEGNAQERLRLYLIRHGEVEGAASGKLFGWTDTPLSQRGLEQSRKLAETLSSTVLSAIYSSDMQRTRVLAERIARCSEVKVQESSTWREIDMGDWEGRTMASLHDEAPQLVARLFADPASFGYPGGESFVRFTARVLKAVDQLLMTHSSGEVVLVAHGGVCRAIIGSVLGMPARYWLRLARDYSCLNVIDWYDGNPLLQRFNLGYEQASQIRLRIWDTPGLGRR